MNIDAYGVKIVYKYVVHSQELIELYEEQILKVFAESFDDAYKKADEYIENYIDRYTNINGDFVDISLHKIIDCFLCYDEQEDIAEIYSGFLKLDDKALKSITKYLLIPL